MEIQSFAVQRRTGKGTLFSRRLRRSGLIPAVVYGLHEPTPLTVDPKELEEILHTRAGANVVFQLNVEGEKTSERPVIVKELQRDPIKGDILHADFLEIQMDRKIEVEVPLVLKGEAPGVKLGGILSQVMRTLEVECLPVAIPEEISVDISKMDIGDVFHVRDLRIPAGVDLIADGDEPVAIITAQKEEEVPAEEAEEVAEAAAAGEEAPSEPTGDASAEKED